MQLLRISDKVSLAFGLTWEGHDSIERSLHAQIKLWQARGLVLACKYARLGDSIYGLDTKDKDSSYQADKTHKPKLVSGAGLIAMHPSIRQHASGTVLVVIEVQYGDHPLVITVGLKNGVVVFDRLSELADVENHLHTFTTLLPRDTPLVLWGDVKNVALPGVLAQAFGIDQLVQKKLFNALEIKPLRSTQPLLIAGALAGVGVVVGAAWMGWDYLQSQQEAAETLRLAAFNTPELRYQKEIERLFAAPITPMAAAIATVQQSLGSFPVLAAGWQLDNIECMGASCTAQWLRVHGTLAEFQDFAARNYPDWANVHGTLDKLTHTIPIELPQAKLPAQKDWPRIQTFTEHTYSLWQSLEPAPIGWRASLAAPTQQALPDLPPGQAQALKNFPAAPMAMVLDIQQQPMWLASVSDVLSPVHVRNLGVTTVLTGPIALKFDGREFKFTAKGLVYAQY